MQEKLEELNKSLEDKVNQELITKLHTPTRKRKIRNVVSDEEWKKINPSKRKKTER